MRKEIEIVRGTSEQINITIKNTETGEPYTLASGEKVLFGVKKTPKDEALLIIKTITELTDGLATVELFPADTIGLEYGRYVYDVGLESGEHYYPIVKISPFVITANVTKRGDGS